MARRSPRSRKPLRKVLSTSESKHVELCYALEGKAYTHLPKHGWSIEFLLIDSERRTRWVKMSSDVSRLYPVDEDCAGWRILGWRLVDGQPLHGDYDVVDPELADLTKLPEPPNPGASKPIGRERMIALVVSDRKAA